MATHALPSQIGSGETGSTRERGLHFPHPNIKTLLGYTAVGAVIAAMLATPNKQVVASGSMEPSQAAAALGAQITLIAERTDPNDVDSDKNQIHVRKMAGQTPIDMLVHGERVGANNLKLDTVSLTSAGNTDSAANDPDLPDITLKNDPIEGWTLNDKPIDSATLDMAARAAGNLLAAYGGGEFDPQQTRTPSTIEIR